MFSNIEYHSKKDKNFKSHFFKLKFKERSLHRSVSFFIDKTIPHHPKTFFKKGKIDEGAYGEIFKFTEATSKQQYLTKEMSFLNPDELKSMLQEAELYRKANGFCGYHVSLPDTTFRLVMKRLPGKPLIELMDTAFPDHITMIRKYIAILHTTKSLHKKNIVHGDLSLRNILLDDYIAYFCDFGLATKCGQMTSGSWSESYAYHAPELKEKIPAAFNQDIYSLGVILSKISAFVPGINAYSTQIDNLLDCMIMEDPKKRISLADAINACFKLRDLMYEKESSINVIPHA